MNQTTNYEFRKTERQNEAVEILGSSASNILLEGGSRSGKSFILMRSIFVRAAKEKSRHIILRQNFNHVKRSIWKDTMPKVLSTCFPLLKPIPNNTDFYMSLSNGSEVWIGGLDDQNRVEKILGTEYSTIWFNEISQIDYQSIQVAKTRLAEKNSLAKKIYYDANPPKKSHWSYWLFHKKLDPIDEVPLTDPENYASLLMNPTDNIENIDPDYIKMLEKMPENDRNRFLLGLYNDESEGQVYYAFRQDTHVRETKLLSGTVFIGLDFNVNPFCAVIGQIVGKEFHIHDEVYLENSDTYRMSDELKRRGYTGAMVIPDSTGGNRKTSGKSDFDILKEHGFKIHGAHNPFVTDRVNNVNRILSSNRLVINPKCRKLINDLHKVSWKDNKLDQSGSNKSLTHISDALGYFLWKLEPITSGIKSIISMEER